MKNGQPPEPRDYLAELTSLTEPLRTAVMEAGREINYLRTMVRDMSPYLPADHPWRPGIDEIIASIGQQSVSGLGPYCSWCQARLPEHAPACEKFGEFEKNHPNNQATPILDGPA